LWYRNQEIENLRNEEEKKGFAAHNWRNTQDQNNKREKRTGKEDRPEVSLNSNHSKSHSRKITERVAHKDVGREPVMS
jgi:hypothetical protein